MSGLVISARIPASEHELISFIEKLDRNRSKVIVDALKLYLARFDMSIINVRMKQLRTELEYFEDILDWKRAWDKLEMEKMIAIQQSEVLKKWANWYKQRPTQTLKDEYLKRVLTDIREELEYPELTEKQFKEFADKKDNWEVKP